MTHLGPQALLEVAAEVNVACGASSDMAISMYLRGRIESFFFDRKKECSQRVSNAGTEICRSIHVFNVDGSLRTALASRAKHVHHSFHILYYYKNLQLLRGGDVKVVCVSLGNVSVKPRNSS